MKAAEPNLILARAWLFLWRAYAPRISPRTILIGGKSLLSTRPNSQPQKARSVRCFDDRHWARLHSTLHWNRAYILWRIGPIRTSFRRKPFRNFPDSLTARRNSPGTSQTATRRKC